jgi:hypothetical protein
LACFCSKQTKRRTKISRSPLKFNIFLIPIMPQTTPFQPNPITNPPSACATCPFFSDFHDRDRGLCEVFDRVFKKHNPRTSDCNCSIESLLKQPKNCTVKVELVTEAVEDDGSGHAVPLDSCTVELTVAQPIRALVKAAIATQKKLQGWEVARFWQQNPDGSFEI